MVESRRSSCRALTAGALVGVQRLATKTGDLAVRGNLQAQVGQTVGVRLEQYLCFSQQGQLLAVPA